MHSINDDPPRYEVGDPISIPEGSARQQIQYFDRMMGGDARLIDGMLVYSNGARRDTHHVFWYPPPVDPYQRALIRVRYFNDALEQEEREFHQLRDACLGAPRPIQPEEDLMERRSMPVTDGAQREALSELRERAARIEAVRQRLAEARRDKAEHTPPALKPSEPLSPSQETMEFRRLIEEIQI